MKLLFLPGLMCDQRLFHPQVEHLQLRNKSIDVYNYPMLPSESSMEGIARAVIQNIDQARSTDDELIVAGLSMGGIVAMECARLYPRRVKALALLDSNALDESSEVSEQRKQMLSSVEQVGIVSFVRQELLPQLLHPRALKNLDLCELMVSMAEQTGIDRYRQHANALADRSDYTETLKAFAGPAIIIAGANDTLCPPPRQHHLQSCLPQAHLHFIGRCGHISTLENPDSVNQLLSAWIQEF